MQVRIFITKERFVHLIHIQNKKLVQDKKKEDISYSRILMIIFIPVIAIIILCFRYYTLRIICLSISSFCISFLSYKSYTDRNNKLDKQIITEVLLLFFLTVLGIFIKTFGDLVLSFWAI